MYSKKESLEKTLQYAASEIYRNLTILVETLPRMSDADRKISIINFARESRSLFFRLLAIVSWSQTTPIYDEAESAVLKVRAQLDAILETANRLYQVARVQMPGCTLPLACVLPAIDILSSGSYNRLPTCFRDFPVDKTQSPAKIQKNICSALIDTLAKTDLSKFNRILFMNDHLILQCAQVSIKLTTLLNSKGPWKIFEIIITLYNAFEKNRTCASKKQILFLKDFVENKMNSSETPFETLYTLISSFRFKIIFEILRIQISNFQSLTHLKCIFKKDLIQITYWQNIYPGPYVINFKMNNNGVFLECVSFPDSESELSNMTEINSFGLIQNIIKNSVLTFFYEIYERITTKIPDYNSILDLKDESLIFSLKLQHGDFSLYFSINYTTGDLKIDGLYAFEFLELRGNRLMTDSDISIWIDFLEHYRLFSILKTLKNLILSKNFTWLKISQSYWNVPLNSIDDNTSLYTPETSFSRLYNDFGQLFLACASCTSITSLVLVGTRSSNVIDYGNYELILIDPIIKNSSEEIEDILVKRSLIDAKVLDVKFFNEIPIFKKYNFVKHGLSPCIDIIIERSELTSILMDLNIRGWDKGYHTLASQSVFNNLSLINFFIDRANLSSCKNILTKFLIDAKLTYCHFKREWSVDFVFSDYLQTIYKNTITPKYLSFPLKPPNPLKRVLDLWSSFIYIFEMGIKVILNKFFWDIINSVEFTVDSIFIRYGGNKGNVIRIKSNNLYPEMTFYSNMFLGHLGDKNTCKIYERYYHSKPLIQKIAYYIIGVTDSISLLTSLQKFCIISEDLTISQIVPNLTFFQASSFTFFFTYKNSYAIEINFLNGFRVQLRDGCYINYLRDKNFPTISYIPIYFLGKFLASECKKFNTECITYPPSCFQIDLKVFNDIMKPSIDLKNKDGTFNKYSKFEVFLESCFLLRNISSFFKLSQYFLIDTSAISFRAGNFMIVMGYNVFKRKTPLYVSISIYDDLTTRNNFKPGILLERYLYNKILAVKIQSIAIAQFFSLFKLNMKFLEDFLIVLRMELTPRDDLPFYVEWRHIPNVGQPLKQTPLDKYVIFQGKKYVVMIDYVLREDPSIYITQLFIWDGDSNMVIDFTFFLCPSLAQNYDQMIYISNEIRQAVKEIANKKNLESLPIHNMVQISLRCLCESEKLLYT